MRRVDELIQRFLDSVGQREGSVYVGLFRSWQSIVGERIAAHAQPVDVRGHSLVVEADHPGWVQMVMIKRARIVQELQRRFPQLDITGLTVRVVDRPGAGRPGTDRPDLGAVAPPKDRTDFTPQHPGGFPESASARSTPTPSSQPPSHDEEEALDRIEDDDLRDALARLRDDLEESPGSSE